MVSQIYNLKIICKSIFSETIRENFLVCSNRYPNYFNISFKQFKDIQFYSENLQSNKSNEEGYSFYERFNSVALFCSRYK